MRLQALRPLTNAQGPFVTVHAEVTRSDEHALDRLDALCTTTRHKLEHHKVAEELIADIEGHLRAQPDLDGAVTRTLIAAEGEILLDEVHPGHSAWGDSVEVGPIPDLAPWALAADDEFCFALVLADREGADVELYSAPGRLAGEEELHGETRDITKVAPGDWAQKQYQRRAENVWAGNAEMVAEELRSLHRAHHPRFVALAGDERARAEITARAEGLPIRQIEAGGRGAGASRKGVDEELRRLLAEEAAREEVDVMERLARGRSTERGYAEGLQDTAAALARAEVDDLVIDVRRAHELLVTPADHPGLALPPSALEAGSLPADAVLLLAAAATGAELTQLPAEQSGGAVAALLRWDMNSED